MMTNGSTCETEYPEKSTQSRLPVFVETIVEHGFLPSLKSFLSNRGFSLFSKVRYPVKDMEFTVRSSSFWKGLQEEEWELQGLRTIADLAQEGDTILDVGAWIGPYTLLLSRLVRSSGLVCSFEPDPSSRQVLIDNVWKNRLSNVLVEPCCVVDNVGSAILRIAKSGDSSNSVVKLAQRRTPRQVVVQATTIDAYCKSRRIRPNGIKIDVEGAEGIVLRGARKTLKEYSPWVLLEFHNCFMSEETKRDTWETLTDGARDVTYIEGTGSSHGRGDAIATAPTDEVARLLVWY